MAIMIQMMKEKEKACLKNFFNVIPIILSSENNFLYISKVREENAVNGVINKITEDFEKIVTITKSKELKQYVENILPNYKKLKN